MDKNRHAGSSPHAMVSINEAIGKITGNHSLVIEGATQKTAGKVRSRIGRTKDGVRDVLKR